MAAEVDIILPTHCRPHTIGYALHAVLTQTYPHFVVHVVGDGCDDETERVVRAIADGRVRFHRFSKAMGFGYANRNAVLRETAAPFVAYASDDDLWFPDHLERGVWALETKRLDLVAFRPCHVQFPDTLDLHFFAFDWGRHRRRNFLRNWFLGAVTLVHRRRVFDRVGLWNDRLFRFGDREFYNRVRRSPVPSVFVDELTVLRFYAQHWDAHYAELSVPPQQRYLERVRDLDWCAAVRHRVAQAQRSRLIRQKQWQDFFQFGMRSGPKFVRFWYQRLADRLPRRTGAAAGRV
jgi:glycosyltransferase involved in cell wall biosynthesis